MGVEGKLLLRCAERDAKRASSGISRGEMRESHVSLETPLSEEIATLEVGGHTEPRVGMMNRLAHGEVWAPCRWTGAMQMLKGGAMQMGRRHAGVEDQRGCDF